MQFSMHFLWKTWPQVRTVRYIARGERHTQQVGKVFSECLRKVAKSVYWAMSGIGNVRSGLGLKYDGFGFCWEQ
jgi:hypothetical protein